MSAVQIPPVKIAPYIYRYSWTGTAPFRVFDLWGWTYLFTQTNNTTIDIISPFENQAIPIQVYDSTDGNMIVDTVAGLCKIQWRGAADAVKYEIDYGFSILNGTPETGAGYYTYLFPHSFLYYTNDGTINIIKYDQEGNTTSSQATTFNTPSSPLMFQYSTAYDSGTNTISVSVISIP